MLTAMVMLFAGCKGGNNMTELQTQNNHILGEIPECITPDRMAEFVINKTKQDTFPIQTDLDTLCSLFLEEGKDQGVRGDIAFCQSIKETGWFRYGGQVLPEQNNYAGIGATNNSAIGKGAWFESPRIGVRAQIQHLFAYANSKAADELAYPCVDPRFNLVSKGVATSWTALNGRWAVPGNGYGESILALWEELYNWCQQYEDEVEEVDDPVSWEWAVENGLMYGDEKVDEPMTRQEVVKMVYQSHDLLRKRILQSLSKGLCHLIDDEEDFEMQV